MNEQGESLGFVNRDRLEANVLTYLRLLPLVDVVGVQVKITDWSTPCPGAIHQVEVEQGRKRTWMELDEAAALITKRIAEFITMSVTGGNDV